MTMTFFSLRPRALLRGHDDVLVVRQHKDRLRRDPFDLGQNALGGGVHGLSAVHDAVRAEVGEHGGEAVTRAHGKGSRRA